MAVRGEGVLGGREFHQFVLIQISGIVVPLPTSVGRTLCRGISMCVCICNNHFNQGVCVGGNLWHSRAPDGVLLH